MASGGRSRSRRSSTLGVVVGLLGLTVLGAKWPLAPEALLSLTYSSHSRGSSTLGVVVGVLGLIVLGAEWPLAAEVLLSLT